MPGTSQLRILLDSDGVIAMAMIDDSSHKRAEDIFASLTNAKSQLLICSTTLAEVLTALQRRFNDRKTAESVYDELVEGKIEIVEVGVELFTSAYGYYQSSKSKKNTIFDAINIAAMKSLNLDAIFSFDGWYSKNGIKLAEKFLMTSS